MADNPDQSSFLERLFNSRSRDLSFFLPFLTGFTADAPTPESDPDNEPRDRIILINPWTQGIVVIEGRSSSSSSLDSLLRDLMSKEGQPPASKESIKALPRVEIKEGEGECAICLEEWGVGDVASEMPCKHRFHEVCVERWLKIHGTCPVCRYKMPVDDHELGKEESTSQTVESNERESEGRERMRREIWVSFAFRNEGPRPRDSSSAESNDS